MADELDDIFGAIDGDEEVVESDSEDQRKTEDGDGDEDDEEDAQNDEAESEGDDDVDMEKTSSTADATKLFNSIDFQEEQPPRSRMTLRPSLMIWPRR